MQGTIYLRVAMVGACFWLVGAGDMFCFSDGILELPNFETPAFDVLLMHY